MRLLTLFFLIAFLLPCTSAVAQFVPCDLNHNGYIDVGDLGAITAMVGGTDGLDTLPVYFPELDCDQDSLHLTINDAVGLGYRLTRGYVWGQGHQWWLPQDSLCIPETYISRGGLVDIPVYVQADHPLTNVQFALRYDPDVLQIEDFIVSDSIPDAHAHSIYKFDDGISVIVYLAPYDDEIYYSGHLGNLRARALIGSPRELETVIEFFTEPHRALYNGITTQKRLFDPPWTDLIFIHPTTVDGIITIVAQDRRDLMSLGSSRIALDAYPNPFNNSVEIALELDSDTDVDVAVFDLLGREVARIYDGRLSAGKSAFVWQPSDQPSGVYFCRVHSGEQEATRRITLLR